MESRAAVIAVLVADGVPGHQLTVGPMVFTTAATAFRTVEYDVRVCAATGTVETGEPVLRFAVPHGLDTLGALGAGDTVLVTGHRAYREPPAPALADALRGCAARGCRMAAVGTGSFTLAALGLLDGRRATTSWPRLAEFTALFPRVTTVPSGEPSVADGPFHTAAGVFGGLDLAVDLVERDHGVRVAAEVARRILLPFHDQVAADHQEIEREAVERGVDIGPTLEWLETNLHRPLTLDEIAAHAGVSVSSLNRRFRARTGQPPLQYLLGVRLQRAQLLLENSETPVEQIAARTGFGSSANLRHHFQRRTGTSPRGYRAAHRVLTGIAAKPEGEGEGEGEGEEGRGS
ncbi:helix-turn-helix domain-containing protein [Streptomyces sp. NPDC048290]|uniref:GlxA family transcriptional regulator n=1 Tax=Streptomyces sp. NPDC048290 TaxID=3155811 RepID=UPI0034241E99